MNLDEILNKVLPYKITEKKPEFFQAEFESNGRRISIMIDTEYSDDSGEEVEENHKGGEWNCEFSEFKNNKHSHTVTGSGGEFEVFATLKEILKVFFWTYKPDVFKFDANKSEGSRADLYQRLFTKGLPAGYKLDRDDVSGRFDVKFRVVKT